MTKWTPEEDSFLRDNLVMTYPEIAAGYLLSSDRLSGRDDESYSGMRQ